MNDQEGNKEAGHMTTPDAMTIAELQRANAALSRRLEEERTAREAATARETALGEVLEIINRSSSDPGPVFDAILEKAIQLCGPACGGLSTFDGESFQVISMRNVPPAYVDFFRRPWRSTAGGLSEHISRKGGEVVHIADISADKDNLARSANQRASVELADARTALYVGLRRDGSLIGLFTLFRQEVRPFTDSEIALVRGFAAQAAIAMENARLLTEQQEALAQQTATAEVLQIINESPGDLRPVFDAIIEKAIQLCGPASGGLSTFDGEYYHVVSMRDYPPAYGEHLQQPWRSSPGGLSERILQGGEFLHVADIAADEDYLSRSGNLRAMHELGGARTTLWVGLRKDNVLLGLFTLYRQEVRPFTVKEIALVRNFAAQAVIAIENARLMTEQREALDQQTATAEVLQVINASPGNLAPVFDAVLGKALRLCGADFGVLGTFDGTRYDFGVSKGASVADVMIRTLIPEPDSVLGRVASGEPVVHIHDLVDTEGYRNGIPSRVILVERTGARTALWVGLRKDDAVMGVIVIYRKEVRPFSEKQISLVENFAAQAVIAMENARLMTEQREALDQQTATAEVLQVINASPGDVRPVFEAMLDRAIRLCGPAFGIFSTFDGTHFHTTTMRGIVPGWAEHLRKPFPPTPGGILASLVDGARSFHLADSAADKDYLAKSQNLRIMYEVGGARTALWIGLRNEHALIGLFVLFRPEVRPFTAKEIALLENFAAQAVLAMESARLISEQREALEQQTATAEVLQVINASPGDVAPVFEAMLDRAIRLCGPAFGTFSTFDGTHFHATSMRGITPAWAEHLRKPFRPTPGGILAKLVEGVPYFLIEDAAADKDYLAKSNNLRNMYELGGARTALFIAMRRDTTLVGQFCLFRPEVRPFSAKEVALLQNFAAQAVLAMESARLLAEIRQRQRELRVTFENMGDGVALFDTGHRLLAWNGRFQTYFDVPEALVKERRPYADYIRFLFNRGDYGPDADPDEHLRWFTERAEDHYTYERARPDGRMIEVRYNPVREGGFVLIFSDITDRKRNEAEIRAARDAAEASSRTIETAFRELKAAQANLIQAEKMASLGQLAAGIAHEIKNPLNFINNFSDLSVELLDELKDAAAPCFAALDADRRADVEQVMGMLTSNLKKIEEHGKRADGIVKSMLDHSSGASGERREVDLNSLIEESLNLAFHGARARDKTFNIAMERDLAPDLRPIVLNPQDINRVLLNLFGNGFYAAQMREKTGGDPDFQPVIKVTTRELGNGVEIRVRDNGTGVPEDIRDKLFQPFFTTKPTGEGTGLGLSISYEIITKQHEGTIAVDSEAGQFTEFTVHLPRHV